MSCLVVFQDRFYCTYIKEIPRCILVYYPDWYICGGDGGITWQRSRTGSGGCICHGGPITQHPGRIPTPHQLFYRPGWSHVGCVERPQWTNIGTTGNTATSVLKDHMFLAGGPIFKCNRTCHYRPPALIDHMFMAGGAVFQDRFYCKLTSFAQTDMFNIHFETWHWLSHF